MSVARMILAALIVFVLQITVANEISIAGVSPDLIVVLLILLITDRDPVSAVVIGFLLGFLQDLGNASFLGMNALAKSIVAYGVSRLGGDFLPESIVFRALLIVAASLVNDIIVLIVTTGFDVIEIIASFFRYSILSAVYGGIVGLIAMVVVKIMGPRVVRSRGGY
ncbi:MAG TPA: rod shape-determining protein MreD [Patescibacteria group bacterium]|nr:rod shape-determining protein MreD [Patescibacteria group bacterium]